MIVVEDREFSLQAEQVEVLKQCESCTSLRVNCAGGPPRCAHALNTTFNLRVATQSTSTEVNRNTVDAGSVKNNKFCGGLLAPGASLPGGMEQLYSQAQLLKARLLKELAIPTLPARQSNVSPGEIIRDSL